MNSGFRQVVDEALDLLAAGLAEIGDAAEVGGVALDQNAVEAVLADQQAKAVTQPGRGAAIAIG